MAEILHCAVLEHGSVQENAQIMYAAVLEAEKTVLEAVEVVLEAAEAVLEAGEGAGRQKRLRCVQYVFCVGGVPVENCFGIRAHGTHFVAVLTGECYGCVQQCFGDAPALVSLVHYGVHDGKDGVIGPLVREIARALSVLFRQEDAAFRGGFVSDVLGFVFLLHSLAKIVIRNYTNRITRIRTQSATCLPESVAFS